MENNAVTCDVQSSNRQIHDPLLVQLAEKHGIATSFWDWQGIKHEVPDSTLVAVLQAFGVDAATPESAKASLRAEDQKRWERLLPPVVVAEQGRATSFDVHVYAGDPAVVEVRLEDGRVWPLRQIPNHVPDQEFSGQWYGEASFEIPDNLPLGYHRISITSLERTGESLLIVSPSFVGFPKRMGERRIWGYSAQFYSVRSKNSWGIGDLTDLADLATWAGARQNAGYVLINPVHASNSTPPLEPSPYLPASRRYISPLYIRVEDIPEYHQLSESKKEKIAKLRDSAQKSGKDFINRDVAWRKKVRALHMVFAQGLSAARQMAFDDFRKKEGRPLQLFTIWSALTAQLGTEWQQWPADLQRPSSPQVRQFAEEHSEEITFYAWLQWIVDTQLAQAQLAATNVGMPVGIVKDLAVGVSATGAETWAHSDVFASNMHVGAPADSFNQQGQDWGQPPWRPDRLAELGYAPFREVVSGILRHSGGIRIDHVIGLFRLWWIPAQASPTEGTYVRYDHEALVGIVALEAYRAGALVVGEDLGTVEPWVRDYLRRRGLLGTSILWFEVDQNKQPLPATDWRQYCLASVTTHDLPPTAGYLRQNHVRLREKLGLLAVSAETEMEAALAERQIWLDNLRRQELLPADVSDEDLDIEEIILGLHKFLTLTPSQMLNVALVDAVGDQRTQNQPGTWQEYPNWQIPLSNPEGKPIELEDLFDSKRALRLSYAMNGWEWREEG